MEKGDLGPEVHHWWEGAMLGLMRHSAAQRLDMEHHR